ncbi:MAG: hypothetical protein D6689_04555 [Deltaproteobacteria bacterium]|nr:MAG: hypothetical protein D6689_04555 [Deltaproteobacteria bacterium]
MTAAALDELDRAIDRALDTGDESQLDVLGYGEISSVVRWRGRAYKRLPPFPDADRAGRYGALVDRYVRALAARGVAVVDTHVDALARADGSISVYVHQPVLPADAIGPRALARWDAAVAADRFAAIVDAVCAVVGPAPAGEPDGPAARRRGGDAPGRAAEASPIGALGLDAQLSNWAWIDGRWHYLDVTTPLVRGADGRDELDTDLFVASLPWLLRAPVRRWLLGGILDRYYDPRQVAVDLLANLHKERLAGRLPSLIEVVNARVSPPVDEAEVARYYRADARLWAWLLRLRRLDRAWQRRVRRRRYPFLLPGPIER